MTQLSDRQRAIASLCLMENRPFSAWREPGQAHFSLICPTEEPAIGPVFGQACCPAFVMAPFDTMQGEKAFIFPADILVHGNLAMFRDGMRFGLVPTSVNQAKVANAPRVTRARAPEMGVPPTKLQSRSDYEASVRSVVDFLREGDCKKVVMSRVDHRELPHDYDLVQIVETLARLHANSFVSLVSSAVTGTWITATPEILLRQSEAGVETMALAGTQWPAPGIDISTLQWSEKIVEEQRVVVDEIRHAFESEEIDLVRQTEPRAVRAANLCHLRSDFFAKPATPDQLAGLLGRLHPTAAVCGFPKATARELILKHEPVPRSFYTGYLGPRAFAGETALYVNLRSARVSGRDAFLHVGGGILADSDPTLEWQETVAKTETIACAL